MDDNNQPKKPIFLYVVIIVLVIALAGLGALSFFSLSHLASLQKKVQTLSDTVTEISDSANTLISQADQIALPIGRRNRCQRKHMTFDDIFFHGREVKDLLRILQGSGRMGEAVEPVVL